MRTISSLLAAISTCAILPSLRAADFDGDGYADLAIGCRGEEVNGFDSAGAVHVLYGDSTCFAALYDQVLTEASFVGLGVPAASELFGFAVGTGDFDGDGYDDIAIAAAGERINGLQWAGAVFVSYGSPSGIDLSRRQVFNQDTPGIKDKVEPSATDPTSSSEGFGRELASGDFDGDGFDDLAIHVVESFGKGAKAKPFAGAIHLLRGSATGLTVKGNKIIHQNTKGVPGKIAAYASFGDGMVAADFDGDGIDDLAVGAPLSEGNGTVTILRGKQGKGLSGKKSVVFDETDAGGFPAPIDPSDLYFENAHRFGDELAVGDFAGNGGRQLVIGTPFLEVDSEPDAGGVYVLQLEPTDLSLVGAQLWTRETSQITGGVNDTSYFGIALAAGDYNADGRDDLVIGCPQDDAFGFQASGSITVLPGSPSGLSNLDTYLSEDNTNMPDTAEYGDQFGTALAAADFDNDGDMDLAIGVAGEQIDSIAWTGAVTVLEGKTGGAAQNLFDLPQSHWIDKSFAEIPGTCGGNDSFGNAFGK